MIACDFHVHTDYSDGKHTIDEVAAAAYARGMTAIGFSDHGYAACDVDCCMPRERIADYRRDCERLKREYAGRMDVYCGIEQDFCSDEPADGYDYVIGSVHYLHVEGEYLNVDWKRETMDRAAFLLGGDMLSVAEEYYRMAALVVERTHCQLIGHFDLVTKLNERERLFDVNHPRYVAAWQKAADALLKTGVPFEINTGAVARGYRTESYPALPIRRYLRDRGARFVLSSDSHAKETLLFGFEQEERLCRQEGFVLAAPDWMKKK